MKNDLDFIKEKIEAEGVKAPADMDEAFVLKAIENTEPKPVALPKKKKGKIVAIAASSVAAVLVLTVALTAVIGLRQVKVKQEAEPQLLTLPGGLSLRQFDSYESIEREVEHLRSANGYYSNYWEEERSDADYDSSGIVDGRTGAAAPESGVSSQASGQSSSHNDTYIQVTGVDESDIIKTDGRYLYCVESGYSNCDSIVIFSAEGKNTRKVSEIGIYGDSRSATIDETSVIDLPSADCGSVSGMYLTDGRLIVVCDYTDTESTEGVTSMTRVNVYDVSDIENITLLDSYSQSGNCISSRMIDDTVYLVSAYYPYDEDIIPCCGSVPERMSADCIYGLASAASEEFLVVSAYNTADRQAATDSKAILGGVDDIYCNQNNLYIYTATWDDNSFFSGFGDDDYSYQINTQILRVDLTNGVKFEAYAEVEGSVSSQYAMDEYNGNLRVATTSFSREGSDINNLFVLDEDLSVIGSVTGFAEDESIRAVRYIGDTAYVITFEQTDPLFVIDLSSPSKPAILGQVEITGFSTMLVPVDENTLLGLGYHEEAGESGFKLALFDVSDKANPQVLDSISYPDQYSAVQNDPKALVINSDRGDYVVPLNYNYWGAYDYATDSYTENRELHGGMLNFKIENGKLVEITRYDAGVESVDRCAFVGDNVYMTYYNDSYQLDIISTPYQN